MPDAVPGSPAPAPFGLVVRFELHPRQEAAFDAHEQTEHTRAFLAERQRFVASFEVAFLGPGSAASADRDRQQRRPSAG
ncbi:hypothetical protein, partial [Nostocoides australiense]|nr:hypothetical protein [Tetrasphaera australiensis]